MAPCEINRLRCKRTERGEACAAWSDGEGQGGLRCVDSEQRQDKPMRLAPHRCARLAPRGLTEPLVIDGVQLAGLAPRGQCQLDGDAAQVNGVLLESLIIRLTGPGANQRMTMRTLHSSS